MKQITLRNQQRAHPVNTRLLREIAAWVLDHPLKLPSYQLSIALVTAEKMARVNKQFLDHDGSTDIITFDYKDGYDLPENADSAILGELFISVPDAIQQALLFKTIWHEELARYLIHGILHLLGFDDLSPEKRKVMKKEENRLLALTRRKFDLSRIGL